MEEKLLGIAKDIFGADNIMLDTEKDECEQWDSASNLILLSELEDEMDIEIPIEEVDKIQCLRDFLKFIKE